MATELLALDGLPLWPGPASLPCAYYVKVATDAWEREQARALRRRVFCDEQRLFDADDGDEVDASATVLVVISAACGMPDHVVGTVRIHETAAGRWQGSRLAVTCDHRRVAGLGAALIRLAVGTAKARGAREFTALVQAQHVPLFRRLYWETQAICWRHGRWHHHMRAALERYAVLEDVRLMRVAA